MSVWSSIKSKLGKAPTKPQLKALLQPKPITGHTPLTWRSILYSINLQHLVLISLPILSLLGLYGTWILGCNNGLFSSIVELLEDPDARLPGTDELLVRKYTGLGFLDNQLTVLVTFFAPVVDSGVGREALSLFSLYGLGQFGGVWTLMVMESLRVGNRGLVVNYVGTIGLIFQNISYTITTPLWLLLHLLTSPVSKPFPGTHANSVLLIPAHDLYILPLSITLSYLLPTILMTLPLPSSTHQNWIAIWQAFPLWTVIIHYLLRTTIISLTNRIYKFDPETSARPTKPQGASYLANSAYVYKFILFLCISTHLPVLLITLLPSWLFPSFSPLLLRLGQETFSTVYIPYFPSLSYEVKSFAEGAHTFLQWDLYIGSMAFVLWAVLLYRNVTTEKAIVDPENSLPVYRELLTGEKPKKKNGGGKEGRKLVVKVAGWWLVSGPIGAVAVLLWERDAIVRQKIKQGI